MSLPLVDRYPSLAGLPHVALGVLPTPVERVILDAPGIEQLWIKRDDLTSSAYGGNKVRKLEFLLGQACAENRRAVITFGAYGSNHALATAVHARTLGLEPHVVLSPQAPGPFAAATLRAHAKLGTVIHPVGGWDGAREAVSAKHRLAQRDGIEPFEIPMGGTNALGAVGYVNAAFELLDQCAVAGGPPLLDVVYVAGGTLGTALGLAIGFATAGVHTRVVAVRVTPGEVANDRFAESITAQTVALLRETDTTFPPLPFAALRYELRHDWFEPGYGVVTPETTSAVTAAAGAHIKLETTYTGKAFAAMLDDAAAGRLGDQTVLFWDTYNSAPMPEPGPVDLLPPALQEYVALCDQLFGATPIDESEGESE
jgi:1-aminocyclopropane-1-carboxylate deaminase/D-cysteine desulfhydrase-like pyridoxal-dependent ACC family enzyme